MIDMKDPFYNEIISKQAEWKLEQDFVIPKETGHAFVVNKGQILRVIACEGPQVADLNAFNLHDPREMFWSGRTRILEKAHVTTGNQIWSSPPKTRPMLTIIADTVDHQPLPHGAASHDVLLARCNSRLYEIRDGITGHRNCQDNLASAIEKFGLTPDYVHDAFNIFMVTGIDDNDRPFYYGSDAKKGDYVDLYAEMDCIIAISACPGGCNGPENLPIGVQVYSVNM